MVAGNSILRRTENTIRSNYIRAESPAPPQTAVGVPSNPGQRSRIAPARGHCGGRPATLGIDKKQLRGFEIAAQNFGTTIGCPGHQSGINRVSIGYNKVILIINRICKIMNMNSLCSGNQKYHLCFSVDHFQNCDILLFS